MKRMLINTTHAEETRIAIVENDKLLDLDIENVDREQKKASIYKAKISRIEPSLNAIFVNYGEEKNGFLPMKEISTEYFKKDNSKENIPLNELLDVGQELIVQIAKEERGTKGAALTTFITLAGCYMVLMPNNPTGGGISRRIEGEERDKLKRLFDSLNIPKNMSVIIRTAGVDRTPEEIQWDLDSLVNLWDAIKTVSHQRKAPFLIHKESDITIRAIRDHLKEDIEEIIIDTQEGFNDFTRQLKMLRPHFTERLRLHSEEMPLYSKFKVEKQIESAFKREVHLPSGGSIVIDTTEALIAVDVNSARSTKGDNIEETAFNTNLEAAEEVARQLRLRDLGGLIIIDFIDMQFFPNQKAVENKLVECLQSDRAKIQMTRISKFGLVEISRQRLQASLNESVMEHCPRCHGHGFIRTIPSLALSILRNIRTEGIKDKTNEIRVQLPMDIAAYLLNEKRDEIVDIEESLNIKVILIPNSNLLTPQYNIQRIWGDVYSANRNSFDLIEPTKDTVVPKQPKKDQSKVPAVKSIEIAQAPEHKVEKMEIKPVQPKAKKGFFARLFGAIFGSNDNKHAQTNAQKPAPQKATQQPTDNGNKQNTRIQRHDINDQKNDNPRNGNRNDRDGNRNNDRERNDRDGKNSGRNNNRRNNPRNNSNRLQIHQSEDVVEIKNEKAPAAVGKSIEERAMKSISTNPAEKISVMVRDILENANSLSSENAVQVETEGRTHKRKYLKFETIDTKTLHAEEVNTSRQLDQDDDIDVIAKVVQQQAELFEQDSENHAQKPSNNGAKKQTEDHSDKPKQRKSTQSKKPVFIEYSVALDPSTQGYIAPKRPYRPRKSNKNKAQNNNNV